MSKIEFNLLQLIVEKPSSGERFSTPSADSFNELEESFHILLDNMYYEVIVEKEDDYVWFSFDLLKIFTHPTNN